MAHRKTSALVASSDLGTASTKFKIEQSVSNNTGRKGECDVEKVLDPNEVVIKRRFGEGSKPLFEREEICINRERSRDVDDRPESRHSKRSRRRTSGYSSSNSSDSECYRKTKQSRFFTRTLVNPNLPKLENLTPLKRRAVDKEPYFADEKRERERLIHRYGSAGAYMRGRESHRNRSPRLRRRSYSRSYSKSPLRNSTTRSSSAFQKRRRSKSKSLERERRSCRHSPYEPRSRRRQSPRSPERRSRSCSRDRRPLRSTKHPNSATDRASTTQIIPVPVPVDRYGFPAGCPPWPHMPHWSPSAQSIPRYSTPYALPPVMPPCFPDSSMFSSYRPPPPFRMPCNSFLFRPRFVRAPRGHFHPKGY